MFLKYLCPTCNRYIEVGDDIPPAEACCPDCGGALQRSQAPSRAVANQTLPRHVKWLVLGGIVLLAIGFYFANELLMVVAGTAIGAVVYFVPSLLAWQVRHRNYQAILLLNIFLGWTLLGWVAALVWATYKEKK